MLRTTGLFLCLISGCLSVLACSSSDGGDGSPGGAGSGSAGSAGLAQAGSPAAGASNAGASAAGTAGTTAQGGGAGEGVGGAGIGGASGSSAGNGAGGSASPCTGQGGTSAVGAASLRDDKSCLTWTKVRAAVQMTNKGAAKYCAALEQDGISDWRVPTPEEIVTWPGLATDGTAYITGPVYIPNASSDQDGCTGNSHSCNIARYNDNNMTCAWQGVGFTGWVACVSGAARAGTTKSEYAATSCSPCNGSVGTFKVTDCSAFTN